MNLKKCLAALLTAVLLLSAAGAAAQGITLHTISCFAGPDASDEIYVDILRRYEAETGNTVLDSSSASDEAWKTSVLNEFAVGNEPDVLFFFAAGADSRPILSRVVPLEEINREYPEIRLPETEALREEDGSVYAVPVRGYWEGLYVHTDLFEQYGAPLPRDWDSLLEAIRIFRENEIIPIAISLSDIPHYVAELAILACAEQEDQQARPKTLEEVPESWVEAMRVIRELAEAGAFADNAWATYDSAATDVFLTKKAAMRLDGSWFATSIPPAWMDTMEVLPPERGRRIRLLYRRRFHGILPDPPGMEFHAAGCRGAAAFRADGAGKRGPAGGYDPDWPPAGVRGGDAGGKDDAQPAAGLHEQERPGGLAAGMHSGGGGWQHDGGAVLGESDGAGSLRKVR